MICIDNVMATKLSQTHGYICAIIKLKPRKDMSMRKIQENYTTKINNFLASKY